MSTEDVSADTSFSCSLGKKDTLLPMDLEEARVATPSNSNTVNLL